MEPVAVGCEAVDAGPDWVRLRVPGSAVRSIPWGSITAAALPVDDVHMTFEDDMAPITQLRETHVPLWIEYGDGVAVAMLERGDPRSDAIVSAFKERLGSRWIDRLTTEEAAMRMFKPMPSSVRMPRMLKWMIVVAAAMLVLPILAMLAARILR